jgi:pyruvate kinase
MCKIAIQTENSIDYSKNFNQAIPQIGKNITNAIGHSTCLTAHELGAAAIVAVTMNGGTARMISRFRPDVRIIATTPKRKTYQQMALCWGATPLLSEFLDSPDALFKSAAERMKQENIAKDGELIVITGSSSSHYNVTNSLQVHIIGNILASGTGEGTARVCARARVISRQFQPGNFTSGDILVIDQTTNDILRLIKRAKGVITEEDVEQSGAAAAAIALDIPVLSSVENATKLITDGSEILLDPVKGRVYNKDSEEQQ